MPSENEVGFQTAWRIISLGLGRKRLQAIDACLCFLLADVDGCCVFVRMKGGQFFGQEV